MVPEKVWDEQFETYQIRVEKQSNEMASLSVEINTKQSKQSSMFQASVSICKKRGCPVQLFHGD